VGREIKVWAEKSKCGHVGFKSGELVKRSAGMGQHSTVGE